MHYRVSRPCPLPLQRCQEHPLSASCDALSREPPAPDDWPDALLTGVSIQRQVMDRALTLALHHDIPTVTNKAWILHCNVSPGVSADRSVRLHFIFKQK